MNNWFVNQKVSFSAVLASCKNTSRIQLMPQSGLDVESEECGSARIQCRKKFAHSASAFYAALKSENFVNAVGLLHLSTTVRD